MRFTASKPSTGGIAKKLIFGAFGLFFAGIGCMFVKKELYSLQETKAMQRWAETPCIIASSEIQDAGEDFELVLSYTYSFNGRSYTATRCERQGNFTDESVVEIERLQKTLAPGAETRCWVNPDNPDQAVLKRPSVTHAVRTIGFALIFPVTGLFFASIPWLRKKSRVSNPGPETVSKTKSAKLATILFGSVFALVGLLMIKPFLITPLQKANDAKTWDSVPATVISSKVKSHSDDDGTTYSIYIAYRYEVNGREFTGDRYSFISGSSSGYEGKAKVVSQYPKGLVFNVFVNPINPGESVIRRELSGFIWLGLIPVLFATIGIIILIKTIFAKPPALDPQQARQNTVTLKGPSPFAKAVGISLFTILWSGFFMLLIKLRAPIIFPIVLGLTDLGILCAAVYQILAVFNPRPAADLTPGNIHPGTAVSLRWRIDGNAARIEKLAIKVQCIKVTTETSGDGENRSTQVVKRPLYEEEIVCTENAFEITQGAATFKIPDDQPVSRPGNSDGIQWQLLFHGKIARWPDLKQELRFIVYPR